MLQATCTQKMASSDAHETVKAVQLWGHCSHPFPLALPGHENIPQKATCLCCFWGASAGQPRPNPSNKNLDLSDDCSWAETLVPLIVAVDRTSSYRIMNFFMD